MSDAIEKFEDLLVQSGPAFLLGAGCSKCAGLPLTAELTSIAIDSDILDATSKEILAAIKNLFDGATTSHIEDYLSELMDVLAIAERRTERGATLVQVPIDGKPYSDAELRTAAEQIKQSIANAIDKEVELPGPSGTPSGHRFLANACLMLFTTVALSFYGLCHVQSVIVTARLLSKISIL